MNGTLLLINLAGAVGMLLWGTHMVSTGILRGFGTPLRGWIGRNLNGRVRAFLAGVAVTGLLQSSTATSLMATSFTVSGLLGSGVLSLRHFGLVLFIPWRVGAEEAGAAKYGSMASAAPSPI
jgi:Na+/Pi-cotransporter